MILLETKTGKVFQIAWAGVSGIDGALRFEVLGATVADCYQVFSDPQETEKLTRIFDDDRREFEGYTVFKGVDLNFTGSIVVALLLPESIAHAVQQAVQATEPEVVNNEHE